MTCPLLFHPPRAPEAGPLTPGERSLPPEPSGGKLALGLRARARLSLDVLSPDHSGLFCLRTKWPDALCHRRAHSPAGQQTSSRREPKAAHEESSFLCKELPVLRGVCERGQGPQLPTPLRIRDGWNPKGKTWPFPASGEGSPIRSPAAEQCREVRAP